MNSLPALQRAIDIVGSERKLALKLGCANTLVNMWKKKIIRPNDSADRVLPKWAIKIQKITDDQVLAAWLAPFSYKTLVLKSGTYKNLKKKC